MKRVLITWFGMPHCGVRVDSLFRLFDDVIVVATPPPYDVEFDRSMRALVLRVSKFRLVPLANILKSADLLISTGWNNPVILLLAIFQRIRGGRCIVCMDNIYVGSLPQIVKILLFRRILRSIFPQIMVPGALARSYALRLGYKENAICSGYYGADERRFAYPNAERRGGYFCLLAH